MILATTPDVRRALFYFFNGVHILRTGSVVSVCARSRSLVTERVFGAMDPREALLPELRRW